MTVDDLPEWVQTAPAELRPIVHNVVAVLLRSWSALKDDAELEGDIANAATELLLLVDPNGVARAQGSASPDDGAMSERYLVPGFLKLMEASPDAATSRWNRMSDDDRAHIIASMATIDALPDALNEQEGNNDG